MFDFTGGREPTSPRSLIPVQAKAKSSGQTLPATTKSDIYIYILYNLFQIKPLGAHYFLVYLFKLLYMFRATMCPSSGELTVSM